MTHEASTDRVVGITEAVIPVRPNSEPAVNPRKATPVVDLLCIAAAGSIGAIARFLCSEWGVHVSLPPWVATALLNVAACFLAGVIVALAERRAPQLSERATKLLLVGFLGGFSTFSAMVTGALTAGGLVRSGTLAVMVSLILPTLASVPAALIGLWAASAPPPRDLAPQGKNIQI